MTRPRLGVAVAAATFAVAACNAVLGNDGHGLAESCNGIHDTSGRANVDLTGMPFHVAGTGMDVSMFKTNESGGAAGYMSAGTATIDAARKVVNLTGGGDSGGFGALSGLLLAQDL